MLEQVASIEMSAPTVQTLAPPVLPVLTPQDPMFVSVRPVSSLVQTVPAATSTNAQTTPATPTLTAPTPSAHSPVHAREDTKATGYSALTLTSVQLEHTPALLTKDAKTTKVATSALASDVHQECVYY